MTESNQSLPDRIGEFLGGLSVPVLLGIAGLILVGVGAGGYYAYETYDYVQHDNDFCMSCHLMEQPYEQFGQSAHRGLGCKACHQPTLVARTQMALTQVVENPEEISVHAEVPNERCAECHIQGDPDEWRLIANSVGHKVHLESSDSVLQGLQCVECHSTSVHEFSPVDRTCAQSQCHPDNVIQLGGMSDLTIHCAACHTFVAPVTPPAGAQGGAVTQAALDAAILPDQEECFSCHVMRTLVQMPRPDPHGGVCASCHNPHEQSTPAEAIESCANAGCHEDVANITGFHRGLQPGTLERCGMCHTAHDFAAPGNDCASCHPGVLDDDMSMPPSMPSMMPPPDTTLLPDRVGLGVSHPDPTTGALGALTGVGAGWWTHTAAVRQEQELPGFLHSQHRRVECSSCHSNDQSHGGLLVRTLNDCRDCHHAAPVANNCARCHDSADMPTREFAEVREVNFSVGISEERPLTFQHAPHEGLGCASCHAEGRTRSAVQADCASCHEDHHDPGTSCVSCHQAPPVEAHPPTEAHVTCSGAGCHQDVPFDAVPRTRQSCLVCHQEQQDHRPGRVCSECHTLPDPRPIG